jgi:Ca-activated chloride channel family protein
MTFLAPGHLLVSVVVAALTAAYVAVQRRRPRYALRFTNLDLLETVAPHRPGWRRHVPAAALLLALVALVLALARPAALTSPPRGAVIVLAVDVSPSMMATDVAPTRFAAMQEAVRRFARQVPPQVSLGLVSFAGTADVVVPPTTHHDLVGRAVGDLEFRSETALGEAIFAALDAIGPLGGPRGWRRAGVVVMSDGVTTTGRSEAQAAERAREQGVPVSTVAFGTRSGRVLLDGQLVAVPVDGSSLRRIAEQTGGQFFQAASAAQLIDAYRIVGGSVAPRDERREITGWFVGAGLALALLAAVLSLAWFSRIP